MSTSTTEHYTTYPSTSSFPLIPKMSEGMRIKSEDMHHLGNSKLLSTRAFITYKWKKTYVKQFYRATGLHFVFIKRYQFDSCNYFIIKYQLETGCMEKLFYIRPSPQNSSINLPHESEWQKVKFLLQQSSGEAQHSHALHGCKRIRFVVKLPQLKRWKNQAQLI